MSTGECLSPVQEDTLRELYRIDVKYWNWNLWLLNLKKNHETNCGFSWVVLPYRPEKLMPLLRKRMNDLYWEALEETAAEYGLHIRINDETNKIILENLNP